MFAIETTKKSSTVKQTDLSSLRSDLDSITERLIKTSQKRDCRGRMANLTREIILKYAAQSMLYDLYRS